MLIRKIQFNVQVIAQNLREIHPFETLDLTQDNLYLGCTCSFCKEARSKEDSNHDLLYGPIL